MNTALIEQFHSRFQDLDSYPGWARATDFLEDMARKNNCRTIVDVGGGANPLISKKFVEEFSIEYCLVDISDSELDKAPTYYSKKICCDLLDPTPKFLQTVDITQTDLIFSHMFLEHIEHPLQAHKNMHALLKPGGLAVHFYPSANNLPLAINRWVPETVSTALLRVAQPNRPLTGNLGKFPAFYKLCGNSNAKLHAKYNELGFDVVVHTGFIGHRYYDRFSPLRVCEKLFRRFALSVGLGVTSAQLLVLKKQ